MRSLSGQSFPDAVAEALDFLFIFTFFEGSAGSRPRSIKEPPRQQMGNFSMPESGCPRSQTDRPRRVFVICGRNGPPFPVNKGKGFRNTPFREKSHPGIPGGQSAKSSFFVHSVHI